MIRFAFVGTVLTATALGGCGSPEQPAAVESSAVVFNAAGAPTVEFSVPEMMCEASCCPTVRKTLAKLPGVKDVKVELGSKTATVAVDKEKFDPQAAIAALVDLQFVNTTLKGAEPAVADQDAEDQPAEAEAAPDRKPS